MALTQKELEVELKAMVEQRERFREMFMQANGACQALEQLVGLSKQKRTKTEKQMADSADALADSGTAFQTDDEEEDGSPEAEDKES